MLAVCMLLAIALSAQDSTMIFIAADRNVSEVLTPAKIYELPKFAEGKILFRDGNRSRAKLNYNFLNGEIEFINPANDTLAIAKNQMLLIKEVLIDTQSFVYDHTDGYMELVTKTRLGRLFKKQTYVVIKKEKIGAYNQPSSVSDIASYGSFTDNYGNLVTNLKVRENITLVLRTSYFIANEFNFLPATKRNMMDLYRPKRSQVELYLKKNPVDFKNGRELRKMFESF